MPLNQGPSAIGKLIAPLAAEAIANRGPVLATLLADWPAIAGHSVAAFTCPAKLTRVNAASAPGRAETGHRPAANLLLNVEPARALEVQYMIPQLIERINGALGYRAISAIRLLQVPLRPPAKAQGKRPAAPAHSVGDKVQEAGSRLERALQRMKVGIAQQKYTRSV